MHYLRLTPLLLAALALASLAQTGPTPAAAAPIATAPAAPEPTGRRTDDRRPDQPLTVELFGRPVQLGGSWEYTDERRRNFDLDSTSARDRRVREHELKLDARVRLGADSEAFLEMVGLHETRRTQGTDGKQVTHALERGQMWWLRERLGGTPWSLQIGRVALLDRRAWWWDEDLDAVRLRYASPDWRLDSGLAREVARVSSADRGVVPGAKGVMRWFGQATWPWARRHAVDAFWLLQHDGSGAPAPGRVFADEDATDGSDLRARWIGLRASGEWRSDSGARLAYWADGAWLRGREQRTDFDERDDGRFVAGATEARRLSGHAFDLGATATMGSWLRPSLTLGYARGSEGFRQTGLQENKARVAGVKRWQRYGELLQPELSNLSVATVGAGVRLTDDTSLELLAHRYRQGRASSTLAGSRLSADPLGSRRSVGREVDLLLAVRESKRVEFLLKASHFKPGAAFAPDQRSPARAVEVGVSINF
jgi:alginate production protein